MHDTVPNASTENLFCFEVRFTSRNTMFRSYRRICKNGICCNGGHWYNCRGDSNTLLRSYQTWYFYCMTLYLMLLRKPCSVIEVRFTSRNTMFKIYRPIWSLVFDTTAAFDTTGELRVLRTYGLTKTWYFYSMTRYLLLLQKTCSVLRYGSTREIPCWNPCS
jgi:hypothetical protein